MAKVEAEMTKLEAISVLKDLPASISHDRGCERLPDKPECRGIRESLVVVANMGDLGSQVELRLLVGTRDLLKP